MASLHSLVDNLRQQTWLPKGKCCFKELLPLSWALLTPQTILAVGQDSKLSHQDTKYESQRLFIQASKTKLKRQYY